MMPAMLRFHEAGERRRRGRGAVKAKQGTGDGRQETGDGRQETRDSQAGDQRRRGRDNPRCGKSRDILEYASRDIHE